MVMCEVWEGALLLAIVTLCVSRAKMFPLEVGAILWQDITCPLRQVHCLICIEHLDPGRVLGYVPL